jgi:hypothetical protein
LRSFLFITFLFLQIPFITTAGGNSIEFVALTPNPLKDRAQVVFNTHKSGTIEFKIANFFGSVLYKQISYTRPGTNVIDINASSLQNGVYVITLNNGEQILSKKMIINR